MNKILSFEQFKEANTSEQIEAYQTLVELCRKQHQMIRELCPRGLKRQFEDAKQLLAAFPESLKENNDVTV